MKQIENSYKKSMIIKSTPQKAFDALTVNIGEWWGDQDNPVYLYGDEFTMSWGEPWYKFKVIEYNPNNRITWECIDSKQIIGDLKGVEKEWVGTKLIWEIKSIDSENIQLSFTHSGLIPNFICYEVCSTTWDRFIEYNLKKFLEA